MKEFILRTGFALMGRAVGYLVNRDACMIREREFLPFRFQLNLAVEDMGTLICLNLPDKKDSDDTIIDKLTITIKDRYTAWALLTTQMNMGQAYGQQSFRLDGNSSCSMAVVHLLERAEEYLFPYLLARRAVRRYQGLNMKEHFLRLQLYTAGLWLGGKT